MKKLFILIIFMLLTTVPVYAYEISDYYNSEDLSDYYGSSKACTKDGSENDCRNGNEYKFYLKMYDMYYLYKNKYNVTLDLPLIMAALYYGNEQMPLMFASNLNQYDRSSLKDNNTVTNLDWEYDFKNDDCYTYLNANDNSYDMQILAKNMVTKKVTYKCSGDDSTGNSDNTSSNNDGSNDTSEQKSSSSGKSNKSIAENKIFYIGDSWFELLNKYKDAKSSKSYFYSKSSKNADWVLTNYSSAKSEAYNGKSLKDTIPKDTSAFVINFGLNGTSMWEKTQKLIDNLVKDYPGKTVYFIQTPHVGEQYSYGSLTASKMNSNIDKYNSKMKSYCSSKSGVEFINPTKNIVSDNGKGYLKKDYANGTFHLNATGDKQWYKDIISGVKGSGSTTDSSDDSSSSSESSSNGDKKKATDVEISNYDTQLKCDSGTLDKDSVNASYELDLKKYDKFLLEFIKLKYHTPGTEVKSCSTAINGNNGSANTTVSKTGQAAIDKMNEIALAQVSKTGDTYESWYGMYADWCAMFVSWLFDQVGGLDKYIVKSAIAGEVPRAADSRGYGTWYEDECTDSSTVPKAGDIILYDPWIGGQTIPWPQNGNDKYYSSHIGYVYKVDNNTVYSVEGNGNSGGYNGVWKREHSRKDCGSGTTQGINGYFRPNY